MTIIAIAARVRDSRRTSQRTLRSGPREAERRSSGGEDVATTARAAAGRVATTVARAVRGLEIRETVIDGPASLTEPVDRYDVVDVDLVTGLERLVADSAA